MILFYYFNFLKYFNLNVNITKLNYNENIVKKLKSKKKQLWQIGIQLTMAVLTVNCFYKDCHFMSWKNGSVLRTHSVFAALSLFPRPFYSFVGV